MSVIQKITKIGPQRSFILIRLMLGLIFLSEGIQKFLFPVELGVGRFAKIGIPAPEIMAPFVGVVEILFGALIVIGFLTRLASIPLLIDMFVAITSTKIILMPEKGFWWFAHEARTDVCMIMGLLFLLIQGAGSLSVDWKLGERRS